MATITTDTRLADISITNGEIVTISNNARLTIDETPANRPGRLTCTTVGELYVTNNSTTVPLVLTMDAITSDFIFNGQGKFTTRGDWIVVHTGDGLSGQTIDFTNIGGVSIDYPPFVMVETGDGTDVFVPFININAPGDASALVMATHFGSGIHGNVFSYDSTTQIATFGDGVNGNVIPDGARVRYPNIHITSNADTSAVASKSLVDLDPTGTADWEITAFSDRVYVGSQATGASGITIKDVGMIGAVIFSTTIFPVDIDGLYIAPYKQAATSTAFTMADCPTTLRLVNCMFMANNLDCLTLTRISSMTEMDNNTFIVAKRSSANSEACVITSLNNINAGINTFIGARVTISYCANLSFDEIIYSDQTNGVNSSTAPIDALYFTAGVNVLIRKLTLGGAACRTSVIRLIGDCDNVLVLEVEWDAGNQSQYLINTNGSNTTIGRSENCVGAFRTSICLSTDLARGLRLVGVRANGSGTMGVVSGGRYEWVSTGVPASTSGGAAGFGPYSLLLNGETGVDGKIVLGPVTPETDNEFITLTGDAYFNQLGAVFLPITGDTVTFKNWYPLKFIDSFAGAITFTHVVGTGIAYEFRLKNHDDESWTTWATLTDGDVVDTALGTLTGYDPSVGLDLEVRVTATTSDSLTRSFSRLYFNCNRVADIDYDPIIQFTKVGVSGAEEGSLLSVLNNDDEMAPYVIGNIVVGESGTAYIDCPYRFLGTRNVLVRLRKQGFEPIVITATYENTDVIIPVTQLENTDISGTAVYGRGTGATSSLVSFDPDNLRVDIGNGRVTAEDLYDTVSDWQTTETGIAYPEILKFDGRDILLKNSWKFRRKLVGDVNAALDALPVVEGAPNESPDDETNGSIDFGARSVRVLSVGALDAQDIADAVKATLDANMGIINDGIKKSSILVPHTTNLD